MVSSKSTVARATRWRSYAALGVGVLCIAWSALFVRWAEVSGSASAFYRALIATAVLVPWRLVRGGVTPPRRATLLAIAGGVFFAFDLALFNTAVLRTSAANATLLGNNTPLLVAFGAWLLFRERPSRAFWAGLALALIGSTTIVGGDAISHAAPGWGDAMAVGASAFFAAYLLTTGRVRSEADSGMDTLTFTTIAIAASAATLLIVCLALGVPLTGYSAQSWLALAGLGIVTQIGGYLSITYALGHLPAPVTSVGLLAQAPLTALLAVPLLGEPLVATQIIGGALVLVGIFVVNRRRLARGNPA